MLFVGASRVSLLIGMASILVSGRKNEHRLKLLGLDILQWAGGLPREGVGAKKFGMSLETQGEQTLGGKSRDFHPAGVRKV